MTVCVTGSYRKLKNERGAAAVEFALLLPALTLIMLGIMTFGLIFHSYLEITHAAREGVRWASLREPVSTVTARAMASAPGVDWSRATVQVTGVPTDGATDDDQGNPVTVMVIYQLPDVVTDMGGAINGIGSMLGAGPILPGEIRSQATQRVE